MTGFPSERVINLSFEDKTCRIALCERMFNVRGSPLCVGTVHVCKPERQRFEASFFLAVPHGAPKFPMCHSGDEDSGLLQRRGGERTSEQNLNAEVFVLRLVTDSYSNVSGQ